MSVSIELIARWPGKSPFADGDIEHPAVYHMLDVASVAEVLIAPFDFPPPLRDALVLLAALHDLGKIGNEFRAMLKGEKAQLNGKHWEVTEGLLHHHDSLIEPHLGADDLIRELLYAAVAGHHGRPPTADNVGGGGFGRMLKAAGCEALADSASVIEAFCGLWPTASLEGLDDNDATRLSWWLPGFITTADWIGSNAEWFPPLAAGPDPLAYLEGRRTLARRAVRKAGLDAGVPADAPLFNFSALRPMQVACSGIPLSDGPMLAVVEDETGAGKTEAALLLAQRMLLAGKGRGLYIALPTMATADAMFARVREVAGKLVKDPRLTLAHGRSGLSVDFRDIVAEGARTEDEPSCTPWLAENRRRALLADIGIGTIDQAMLAVLRARFSSLRLFGLSSKILIVDEVHEVGEDAYMGAVLERLLQAHAQLGGSAILLTATLPLERRNRLASAFERGAGRQPVSDADPAYPALTIAGGAARRDLPDKTGPRGAVFVNRLSGADEAVALLTETARAGAACVWVRNAVDDAIAAYERLRAQGIDAHLLHARFALCDRKRHETAMLGRFGKNGKDRQGQVLVATQVVESSLDLDFDVMVSDLAPMAALIQRAGRLWRHMDIRPAGERQVPRPVLNVISPDPNAVSDEHWLSKVLDRGAYVYPLDMQWRTACVLAREQKIEAPGNLRALIEAVHGENAEPEPDVLQKAVLRRLGDAGAEKNLALRNVVAWEEGYRGGGAAASDVHYPTRLGQEQRVLVLARWDGESLIPWADEGEWGERWQLSEVQAAASRLKPLKLPDQTAPEICAITKDWPEWKREGVIVCPVEKDGTICEGLHYNAERGLIFASPVFGDGP